MKKQILFLTILGLLSFASFGQNTTKSVDIKLDETGYSARSCVIDSEVFSTNNHPYLKDLCSLKGGKLVNPVEGRKVAKKANKIDKVCCKSGPRYTWTITRGKASSGSCSSGKSAAERFCYSTNAPISNKPADIDYDPKESKKYSDIENKGHLGNKVTSLISKKRGYLKSVLNKYSDDSSNKCGVADTKKKLSKEESEKTGLWNRTKRFVGSKFKSKNRLAASDYSSQGAPICCLNGDGEAVVVANQCACEFKSTLKGSSKVIPANKYQCPKLNEALNSAPKDVIVTRNLASISKAEEEILKAKLKNFVDGHNKCEVVNRASLPVGNVCKDSDKNDYFFMDIVCGKETQQMICHEELSNKEYKATEILKKDCHTEG